MQRNSPLVGFFGCSDTGDGACARLDVQQLRLSRRGTRLALAHLLLSTPRPIVIRPRVAMLKLKFEGTKTPEVTTLINIAIAITRRGTRTI